MNKVLVLARKELRSYLDSPVAYGVVVFFLVFTSLWLFYLQGFFLLDTASLRPYFSAFPVAYILLIPALTMRSWAEERKLGTEELLLTLPLSEVDLVLGKFCSVFFLLLAALVLTLAMPISLWPLGAFDLGVVVSEYLGAALLGAAATALGLFMSSISGNQISAFLGGVVVLLVASLADQASFLLNLPAWASDLLSALSLSFRFESFARGAPDTRDIGFFLFVTILFLFLNVRVILHRKWR